ncbi:MAG: LPS assembly protein LptD [Pseudomonadota bacterium]
MFRVLLLALGLLTFALDPAAAQFLPQIAEAEPGEQMLLESDELLYNIETGRVTAVGNVFIHYRGYQVFAQKVAYDQANNRLIAHGGVRLEEPGGNVVIARDINLADDLRDGFVTALRADTIYRTRIAANRADRSDGNITIFEGAGYTPCYSCRRQPDRPPTWAVKARRVITNDDARTIRFEEPKFEFFGVSSPTLPSFTIPDPTVKRRSGFLIPTGLYDRDLGFGAQVGYFQTLGPHQDITARITPFTRQGVLTDLEYRFATAFGAAEFRANGIYQLDPDAFGPSGDRRFRGSFRSRGRFQLNPRWAWGWDTTLSTDREYFSDYQLSSSENFTAASTLYLTGLGTRNHFDARLLGFRVIRNDYIAQEVLDPPAPFSPVGSNLQGKQALVHPVIDYEGVYDGAIVGGELSYALNTTSLSRTETDAFGALVGGVLTPRFRGVEGVFSRTSAAVHWRRRIHAPLGQVITPFAGAQADLFYQNVTDADVPLNDNVFTGRVMPYVGINYRYPWLIAAKWGTQTIEPTAEIIVRPGETSIGNLVNEDAQSVVFDDTNLFGTSRFSGYDRVEGGIRANVGMRYTLQTYAGGFLSAMFGQSYHLAGRNSYRVPDILDATAASGLATDRSDFVGDVTLNTNGGFAVSANGRFDQETFDVRRAEVSATARIGPLSSRLVYAFLAKEPDLGFIDDREEIHGSASLRVLRTTRLFGHMRYDLQDRGFVTGGAGVAYDDDALSVSLAYSEDHGDDANEDIDRTLFFRFGLRTIGDTSFSSSISD